MQRENRGPGPPWGMLLTSMFLLFVMPTLAEAEKSKYCGSLGYRMKQQQRVVGGSKTSIRKYPYMGALIIKSKLLPSPELFAGGSVIVSKQWAITAAHCVVDFMNTIIAPGHMFVRANTTFWNGNGTDGHYIDHKILKFHVHEQYSDDTNDYDVALLRVKEPFSAKFEIPITIADHTYKFVPGSTATVLGWGTTQAGVDPFTVPELRAVDVNLIDYTTCKAQYRKEAEDLTPRMMCAGAPGRDACIDDSGGPFVQNNILIGLVSWGMECASEEHPGVYTNLSDVAEWVKNFKINQRSRMTKKKLNPKPIA